jgi:Na+-transporting NADH:ubiquinone oxidoreductase subunit C
MIIKQKWFPIIYMFLVTAFFSSIVIGFNRFTGERVEANQKMTFEKAVLTVLPGLDDQNLRPMELHHRFMDDVTRPNDSTGGAYTLRKNGVIIAYALPISGRGFWAPIKGVIGIEADKKTITGLAFYEQNETPGLGAEIAKLSFRKQFDGKVISTTDDKPINIRRPSATLGPSDVHAVTGATQTSTRLENIINDGLNKWLKTVKGTDAK